MKIKSRALHFLRSSVYKTLSLLCKVKNCLTSNVNFGAINGPTDKQGDIGDIKVNNYNILGKIYMKIKIERLTVSEE